ncbi:MAG TPA: ABC-F family ATP-binding cassette domain-containing protein, partial [Firmicutes bacterium]|nr:ABC-F family ATP-binding cassette domain-containing protein [Bacillota bacterium]
MTLLSISELHKSFGDRPVLTGVSFQLRTGEKVGLIGPNGSGKTTLLRAIAGELPADSGEVRLSKQAGVGYLPQKPPVMGGETLRRHLERAQKPLRKLEIEISRLEREISSCPPAESTRLNRLLDRYGKISVQFQQQGGYELESRLQWVALGLGFSHSDLDRELSRFSGGEKTRAQLAALLLQAPDLLMLDEPTNYLDQQGLEWLERYLIDWPRSLIIVTHDRFFLDTVVGRILFLDRGSVKSYPGNYSSFYSLREQERLTQARAYTRQQKLIQKEEKLIREAKADERSKRQASSRQKRLQRITPLELPERKAGFRLDFNFRGRSGRRVIEFQGVTKRFGVRPLFENISFEVRWGDRVALIGPNGAGKT